MKKLITAVAAISIFLASCEVEVRDGVHYHHAHGWERAHYPHHTEVYHHGYHHDREGNEIIIHH